MKAIGRFWLVITLSLSISSVPPVEVRSEGIQGQLQEPSHQERAPASQQIELGASLVNTFLTVRDQDGRLVSDLKPEDFIVLDDGAPQPITHFSREIQLPLSIALAIDRSRSVQKKFQFEQAAATQFLKAVLHPGKDRGLLVAFDSNVYLLHDFTDEAAALADAIQKLTVSGGTSIFDAVYKTSRDKFTRIGAGRKVLILVTDGEDTTSYATLKQAVEMVLRTEVIVYAIGLKGIKKGESTLERLTSDTGGQVFFPKTEEEKLAELFDQLQEELRNQYSLGYASPHAPDGKFHTLTIQTKRKGLTVYARRGYYAGRASR